MKISNDVSAVVYFGNQSNAEFLLLYRYDPEKKENHYRLIKGGVMDNENQLSAIKREINEEVHLKITNIIKEIGTYNYTVGDIKHNVIVYLVKVETKDVLPDSSDEGNFVIKNAIWLDKEKAIKTLNFEDEKEMLINSLDSIE